MAHLAPAGGELRKRSIIEMTGEDGIVRTVDYEDLGDADKALAEKFGYKPVFKREFGYLSSFSFAVSISGLFATVATTFIYPLQAGGSASAVWSWLISGAGCMCIALSVAELVSAYPTCGGLYYTVSRLAPKQYVPVISWITGWINLLGQIAGVASSEYGSAQLLLAAVSIGTDFQYEATANQTVGVMAALTVLTGLLNSLPTRWMERMTKTYVIFHIVILVACAITLLVMAQGPDNPKHSASYVFTNVESYTGWTPVGWSFMFGFLSVSWTMTDYDATAHITEEIREPELKAPWAISLAMAFTYIVGWLFNIVLCFVMGDVAALWESEIGAVQPVAQIFFNVIGKGGAVFFVVCAFIILQFVCLTATQSLARTIFAFSRDHLIPFSNVWTKVNSVTNTPLYAVWISVFWCIAINLIGLGSYIAIAGVFNITSICLDVSYAIPIACKLAFGKFEPGPWNLGKASFFINIWACIWVGFVTIIFLFPVYIPIKADNMNYACAYLVGLLIIAYTYWLVSGKKFYTGPLVEAEVTEVSGDDSSGSNIQRHSNVHDKATRDLFDKSGEKV